MSKQLLKKIGSVSIALGLIFSAACSGGANPGGGTTGGGENPSHGGATEDDTEISEVVSALEKDEYTAAGQTTKKFGLSAAENVGVDKIAFESEKKYPLPADSALKSEEIIDLQNADFEGGAYFVLKEAFAKAKVLNDRGEKAKIKLPANRTITINAKDADSSEPAAHEAYIKENAVFVLSGYNGLYLEGDHTEILILCERSQWKGFLHLSNSKDVRVGGITLDYKNSPVVRGVVESCASDTQKDSVTVKIDEEYKAALESAIDVSPDYISEKFSGTTISYAEKGTIFDQTAYDNASPSEKKFPYCPIHLYTEYSSVWDNGVKTYLSNENSAWKYYSEYDTNSTIVGYDYDGAGLLTIYFDKEKNAYEAAKGTVVSVGLAYYVYNAFLFTNCENLYTEGVTVNTCPGFAYGVNGCKNVYMNDTNIALKENDSRLITSTADGFHIQSCIGDVEITNSLFERTNDDILNIKSGFYMSVLRVNDEKKTVTLDRYSAENALPEKGDVLEFYNAANMEYTGKITVESVKTIGMNLVISTKDNTFCASAGQKCVNVSRNPKLIFKNNIVRNKKNRGILVQCRGAVIENNTFKNIANGAMMITTESYNAFNEAMLPKNISVKNNKFIHNNFNFPGMSGTVYVFAMGTEKLYAPGGTITGIEIENNFFSRNGNNDISLYGAGDSSVSHNLFCDTANTYDESSDNKFVVGLNNSKDIDISENYAYSLKTDRGGVGYTGEVKKENIYLKNNKNIDFFTDSSNLTPLEIRQSAQTISIDGDISDWNGTGSEIAIVGRSYPDGSNAEPGDYESHFGVEMLKLTWKDDGIYMAFKVKDDKLEYAAKEAFWNKDTAEVFFTDSWDVYANADVALLKNTGTAFQLALAPKWGDGYLAAVRTSDSVLANFSMFKVCVKETGDGYQGEAFVPFEALPGVKAKIESGKAMAMSFVFHDSKRENREHLQLSNVSGFVEYGKLNSSKMPRYLFVK